MMVQVIDVSIWFRDKDFNTANGIACLFKTACFFSGIFVPLFEEKYGLNTVYLWFNIFQIISFLCALIFVFM